MICIDAKNKLDLSHHESCNNQRVLKTDSYMHRLKHETDKLAGELMGPSYNYRTNIMSANCCEASCPAAVWEKKHLHVKLSRVHDK